MDNQDSGFQAGADHASQRSGDEPRSTYGSVLRAALEQFSALLKKQSSPAVKADESCATAGLSPILLLDWRSAVSDERGQSFLATTASGALIVSEGTPEQPGRVLWSSELDPSPIAAESSRRSTPPRPASVEPAASILPAAPAAPQPRQPAVRPALTPPSALRTQEVFITSRQSGKRLAMDITRPGAGARLVLQEANGGDHQRFVLTPHLGGFLLSASHSPLTINAAIGRGKGWQIVEMQAHKGDEQVFAVEATAEGDYRIRAPQSGRWLATANVTGVEMPVLDASQGAEQASRWLISAAPSTPRLAVLDLLSVAPRPKTVGALDVILERGQLACVDGLSGSAFAAYVGDFLKRGRDQLMLVRVEGRFHHMDLLEFGGETGASVLESAIIEPGGWIDGWLGPNDLQLVGNLAGDGSSQLLLLHRGQRRPGEQAVLLGLQNGLENPTKLYADNWGERQWLDGWLDPDDVHMLGDFMGLGHDQWLMMNRNPRGGRVRIVDLKGGSPRRCYTEMWGQSTLLDGWMDRGRIMLSGDFLKRGHAQVLFINRNVSMNTGKMLIADFCRAAPPAEVCYREMWGQSELLNEYLADGDIAVAGDFMGRGYTQVLFVSRKGYGDKFLVADFHRGAPPFEPCVREEWGLRGQHAYHESLLNPRSVVLVGRFRSTAEGSVAAQALLL